MRFRYCTLWLCGLIAAVFILQQIFPWITESFKLVSGDVLSRPWILLTSVFLHSGVLHLIYNLFALVLFGLVTERIIGSGRMLLLFILSGILASIGSCFIYHSALGASGAIFGIMGCLVMLRPKGVMFVYGMPMPLWISAFVWAAFDILGLFAPGNVANLAHLAGLGFGLVFGLFLRARFAIHAQKRERVHIDENILRFWEDHYMRR